jgi:hypothetical protein
MKVYRSQYCHEPSTGVAYNLEFKMKMNEQYVQGTPEKEACCLAHCLRPRTRDKHHFRQAAVRKKGKGGVD